MFYANPSSPPPFWWLRMRVLRASLRNQNHPARRWRVGTWTQVSDFRSQADQLAPLPSHSYNSKLLFANLHRSETHFADRQNRLAKQKEHLHQAPLLLTTWMIQGNLLLALLRNRQPGLSNQQDGREPWPPLTAWTSPFLWAKGQKGQESQGSHVMARNISKSFELLSDAIG